ncbi:type IV pilus biogenesis/stability protein PilW [Ideonella sp. BN130291]|uniref:type IV pilus biogenesis/stability protein PilW n=1 Tax=Ideonella sp. BN130291 TaxID=3112940 RepID=UPI002E256201|nr:type IV pilus biogenesis/stability protein PilW [Ideonella sp. BN130291]
MRHCLRRWPSPTALRWMAGVACALALTGCTTTSSSTSTDGSRTSGASSEQGDNDRRARVRLELASAYFARGQTDTALDEVRQALAADPQFGDAYNLRGLIYGSMGNAPLAEESFRRALQLNAHDADAMHNYGWFLCQQRRFDEAQAQFGQAVAQPQYRGQPRTLLAQGVCQARAGQLAEAERTLLRAYEFDPSNPTTAVNLAEVLYQRAEYERARFYIGRVNAQPEQSSAQTLWLAARVENKLGNRQGVQQFGTELRNRFPQAPETLALERGRFDE